MRWLPRFSVENPSRSAWFFWHSVCWDSLLGLRLPRVVPVLFFRIIIVGVGAPILILSHANLRKSSLTH